MDPQPRLGTNTYGPIGMVFFEPQTGRIAREDWSSNFYHYRLRNSHKRPDGSCVFTIKWLQQIINQSTLGHNGIEYPKGFLEELAAAEKQADEDIQKWLHFSPADAHFIPKKSL